MHKAQYFFDYEVYDSLEELDAADAELLQAARAATANAYAPYSQFLVGAVARLQNGSFVTGTNQENAALPVGICAERVLLSVAAMLHPNEPINAIAISYHNTKGSSELPISPCGMCRQALQEFEQRTKSPIRLILSGASGVVFVVEQSKQLLPLSFGNEDMSR